jgi:phage tail protein X
VASFTEQAIDRRNLRELIARIAVDTYDAGPGLDDMSPAAPDSVAVSLADGLERAETIAQVKGGAANPLTEADLVAKLLECGGSRELANTLLRSGQSSASFILSRIVDCGRRRP